MTKKSIAIAVVALVAAGAGFLLLQKPAVAKTTGASTDCIQVCLAQNFETGECTAWTARPHVCFDSHAPNVVVK